MARVNLQPKNLLDTPNAADILPTLATQIANSGPTAFVDGDLTGADVVDLVFSIPDHATQSLDFVIPFKCEVIDAYVKKTAANAGANANTFQLQNAGGAVNISDAMSVNGKNRGDIVRCANLVDTGEAVINAGGTLRITQTKAGGDAAGRVHVRVVLR